MRNVTPEQVAMAEQHLRGELTDRIEGALGELAGAAKEGLMALSVGVGLGVLHELMAAEVDEVVGPKGKHDRDRPARGVATSVQKPPDPHTATGRPVAAYPSLAMCPGNHSVVCSWRKSDLAEGSFHALE